MKDIAVGILVVIVLAIFIQPIVEISNSGREKIIIDAAVLNSCRSAKNNALTFRLMQELEAVVNRDAFASEFNRAFAPTLELTLVSPTPGPDGSLPGLLPNPVVLEYQCNAGNFNNITVTLDFENTNEVANVSGNYRYLHEVTNVTITYTTDYMFRSGLLQFLNDIPVGNGYALARTQTINVKMIN